MSDNENYYLDEKEEDEYTPPPERVEELVKDILTCKNNGWSGLRLRLVISNLFTNEVLCEEVRKKLGATHPDALEYLDEEMMEAEKNDEVGPGMFDDY
jgi:hypothetical protein